MKYEVYYTGKSLATGRETDQALHQKAARYLKLAEEGKAILLQKKLSGNEYEYRCYLCYNKELFV
jgi:hypothetical protein